MGSPYGGRISSASPHTLCIRRASAVTAPIVRPVSRYAWEHERRAFAFYSPRALRCFVFHSPHYLRTLRHAAGRVPKTFAFLCLPKRAIVCYDGRMVAIYQVEVVEHDSTPWDDGHLFSREGAWKRVQALAALLVPGWSYPVFIKVWRHGRAGRVLVYSADLREIF